MGTRVPRKVMALLTGLLVCVVAGLAFAQPANAAPAAPLVAAAATNPPGTGSISVEQSPVGPTGFCLPPAFALSYTTFTDANTFRLTVYASPSLCQPIAATAVIYAMPTDGSAWPQTLAASTPVIIPGPGITTITFAKGCEPAQFDVVTGATPPVISPFGEWHGPLLFPFALDSSEQYFGSDCGGGGNCDQYTPSGVSADPQSAAPGQQITVAGSGTPGTTIQILLRKQPSGPTVDPGVTVPVAPDGTWSTPVTLPADLTAGTWDVAARVVGCDTEVTTQITVTEGGGGSTTTTSTTSTTSTSVPPVVNGGGTAQAGDAQPVVAGASTERALPATAVQSASSSSGVAAADTANSGLAFTGSNVRWPVLAGILMVVSGALLLLRRRRSTH